MLDNCMTRRGILFVVSGPSGVGKGTIRSALLAKMGDIQVSISVTTRKPRTGEDEGGHYFFVDEKEFERMVAEDEFLEYARVYANMYGTPKKFVLEKLQEGQDVLLEIDIQGALQVKNKMPEGVFIFILPPNIEELAVRLASRGQDSQESITRRLAACKYEIEQVRHYDYAIINDRLEEAVKKLQAIITAERCRVKNLNLGCDIT